MNTFLMVNTMWLENFLLPVSVSVILPCTIIWLVHKTRRHELDRKTELAMKAIESGAQIDPNFFSKPAAEKSIKIKIFGRLTKGCILSALGLAILGVALLTTFKFNILPIGCILLLLGIAYIVTYFIGRKQFAAEIAAEEANIGKE